MEEQERGFSDLPPDLWEGFRESFATDDIRRESAQFVLVESDPERFADVSQRAAGIMRASRATEFNEEYVDQPVDDLEASARRVAAGEAFFLNIEGELGGIAVTVSVGADTIILKFAAADILARASSDGAAPAEFCELGRAALALAMSAQSAAIYAGVEGSELSTDDALPIWERVIDAAAEASREARAFFAEYVERLDRRFAAKKCNPMEELASAAGAARAYQQGNGVFYFLTLMPDDPHRRTLSSYTRRTARLAEAQMTKSPGLFNQLRVYSTVAVHHATEDLLDFTRHYDMSSPFPPPHVNFRWSLFMVRDIDAAKLYPAGGMALLLSSGKDNGMIASGRRMLDVS